MQRSFFKDWKWVQEGFWALGKRIWIHEGESFYSFNFFFFFEVIVEDLDILRCNTFAHSFPQKNPFSRKTTIFYPTCLFENTLYYRAPVVSRAVTSHPYQTNLNQISQYKCKYFAFNVTIKEDGKWRCAFVSWVGMRMSQNMGLDTKAF